MTSIPIIDQKLLWVKAAGKCSICRKDLFINRTIIGRQAHIIAKAPNGPRGQDSLNTKERNSYDNLILLCSDHHDEIDKNPRVWPLETLQKIKMDHEGWVAKNISTEKLVEISGVIEVNAIDTENVVGVEVLGPTKFKPGTQLTVNVRNAKNATGIRIGGN